MNKLKVIVTFILFFTSICYSSEEFPEIDSTDIPGGKISSTRYFDGSSLWGYIDGGADLYLEYGFTGLHVQNIDWNQNKFTINIYKMSSEEAGFGIYSVHKFNCTYADSSNFHLCLTPYQVQILHNEFYISIVNNSGSSDAQNLGMSLAKIITGKFSNKDKFKIPPIFMSNILKPYESNLKFFKGILGLQNGASEWSDKFEKLNGFSIYYLPVDEEGESTVISQIKFQNKNELKSFIEQFDFKSDTIEKGKLFQQSVEGKTNIIKFTGENELLYIESNKKPEELKKYISIIEN